ncbi:hypothetical protein ACLMJK_000198 [Lecanora helva]
MNGTPRLRSAYPSTPKPEQKQGEHHGSFPEPQKIRPPAHSASLDASKPMVPFSVIDAPTQRLYVLIFYACLNIWRISDYFGLVSDETESLWLFMKWLAIDSVFLYGLPELEIPWLKWSSFVTALLVILHTFLNAFLMFRIPIPFTAWLIAFTKIFYDRELAVSERIVKPASILHNSSLILGKQIIHILPEGSAMLNPDQRPFCLGSSNAYVDLPIFINQTNPIRIEILRVDIDTNINETIILTGKDIRKLKRQADKYYPKDDHTSPRILQYPVKETGLYRLQKVVDESMLEVQRRLSDTLVLECPTASVVAAPRDKCRGDLSDFYLQVRATPPLQIKYSKLINRVDHGHVTLSIHPENLVSPLARQRTSGALVPLDSVSTPDISWARTQSLQVPLNESLGVGGSWQYRIDEVQDACSNVANYSQFRLPETGQQKSLKGHHIEQQFSVHERPKVALRDYDSQHPVKVAKGKSTVLPIQLSATGSGNLEGATSTLSYLFTPQEDLLPDQQHSSSAVIKEALIQFYRHGLEIHAPGLYTLQSISTDFCSGEVFEPSSCLLLNPPEPDLSINAENIPDKCAGNSIGLLVDLDLLGTPPFQVSYTIKRKGDNVTPKVEKISHLHSQLELRPPYAGHYTYQFTSISDVVYHDPIDLTHKRLILEQDVKPPAAARIFDADTVRKACIDEPATFIVQMMGESPYNLEYELVHRGRRRKDVIKDIESSTYTLTTDRLKDGGEYTLALTSITDQSGCKIFLKAEAKIDVGLQRPRAAFGLLDGQRSIMALEAKKITLPLRLQGEAPWKVAYRNLDTEQSRSIDLRNNNDQIDVVSEGTYEIIDVQDASCPGSVDPAAKQFSVNWIPRPSLYVVDSPLIHREGHTYVKREVCEGDEDSTEISFEGTAPFDSEYEQSYRSGHGSPSKHIRRFSAGLKSYSVRMETSETGLYEYKFLKLGDSSYSHDPRRFRPLVIQQRVHPRPSASFSQGGKTYKYCIEEDAGGEMVPITLTGLPPFQLELEIKHHANLKPELINIPNVDSNIYNLHIPHKLLALGTHSVSIKKVRDSRGCQRSPAAQKVQVSVAEVPSISPLEDQTHYCVGDRISYALSGTPPFNVYYTFQDHERKATVPTTDFRRIAEKPGSFVITAISDFRSTDACRAKVMIGKEIHEMPSVRVSKGRTAVVDIHEGAEAEILFEFGGTPPFHFTYTRSTTPTRGHKSEILETKNEVSQDYSKTIRASDEGTYEVVSIRDRYCSFSTQKAQGKSGQKLLQNR